MQLCMREQCPALQYYSLGIRTGKGGVLLQCSSKYSSPEAQTRQLPVLAAQSLFQSTHTVCSAFLAMPAKRRYSYPTLRGSTEKRRWRRKSFEEFGGFHARSPFTTPFSTMVWLQAPRSWTRVVFWSLKVTVVSACHNCLIDCSLLNCLSKLTTKLVAACLSKWAGFLRLFQGLSKYIHDSEHTISVFYIFG